MATIKELYSVVTSADYTENIHIPLSLATRCKSFCLYNSANSVPVTVTVKGKTLPIPVNCSSGEVNFERDWFSEIDIDASELGHDFILELYRD